jgi:hypothetical protein
MTVRPVGGMKIVRDVVAPKETKEVVQRCILDTPVSLIYFTHRPTCTDTPLS